MAIGVPLDISGCRRFFLEPRHPRQRQYEALRAYFVEGRPVKDVARAFGYTVGSSMFFALTSGAPKSRRSSPPRAAARSPSPRRPPPGP